jgi:hypothetical protein
MVAGIGPRDEGSVVQAGKPSKADSYGEVKRLSTIQKELGHHWIDILKVNIDGMEWTVFLKDIFEVPVFSFSQVLIELHHVNVDFYT